MQMLIGTTFSGQYLAGYSFCWIRTELPYETCTICLFKGTSRKDPSLFTSD